ncbi:MAG: hypothetical protein AAB581_00410 [Patescibacteria group bacterium]
MGESERKNKWSKPRFINKSEILSELLAGRKNFQGLIFSGDMTIDANDLAKLECKASLQGIDIRGKVIFDGFKNGLDLSFSMIRSNLILAGLTIEGDLNLEGATIKGYMDLKETRVIGTLDLTFESPPQCIIVSLDMAERVHWAAPTVPLVVV